MQFPPSSHHDSVSDSGASPRIEPTIGDNKPAPWDVKPETAPAFALVDDPKDDWGSAKEPTLEEPPLFPGEPDARGREEPHFLAPGDEPVALPEVPRGLIDGVKDTADATLTNPTAESASEGVAGLADAPAAPEPARAAPEPAPAVSPAGAASRSDAETKKRPGFLAFMKKGAEEARSREARDEREAPTDEQLAAREKTRNRLIGAAAILMAVVVGSTFVLDNETLVKSNANVSTATPPVPEKATGVEMPTPETVMPPKNVTPVKVEPPKVVNAAKATPEKKAEKKPEAKAEKKPEKKPEPKAKQPEKKAAVKAGSGYFIQIVVTSSEAKADRMVRDLKRLKLPAYSEEIKGKKGPLWRVRIGHFKSEKEAKNTVAVLALNGYTGKHYIDKQ